MNMLQIIRPLRKEPALPKQKAMGFFTDTSLCIGCKACEVACKQWNQLPANEPVWRGSSYDNTGQLSAQTWRHVQFIEQVGQRKPDATIEQHITFARENCDIPAVAPGVTLPVFNHERRLM